MRQEKTSVLLTAVMTVVLGVLLLSTASSVAAQNLKQTEFDDGTGSIGLPDGWTIDNAYRGSVVCLGPNEATVVLGLPWTIQIPGTSLDSLPPNPRMPRARTGDIGTALRELLLKQYGATTQSIRAAPAKPIFPGTPAYYLFYEFVQNGKNYTGIGYFTTIDYGPSSPGWHLYSSAVVAPRDQFPQTVKIMLDMWATWRPNRREPREGSTSAIFDKIRKDNLIRHEEIGKEFRELL